ncbi:MULTISPECIES: ATP-binding protein [unclassified Mycolicibacterium]|jgi:anti-sigma regulatory factor (Ser/Thr protein kinase)|uniref:ATP-binding protein n=1 Tax=unclassified Mycolicibacterium TaxID=2636767 RepID=UPI00224B8F87|nr:MULTISPECIES: ATP-binding protein [unclassified Mycolicibacterium]MCX2711093.1 ATP-binding protein [Mycolicibacterium sp. J2]MDX1874239.1 ATP-binding protein [Mycolicibacterium sp. 120266]
MTGINGDDGVPASGDRSVELRVAARLENLAVLRTLVAAAATFEDLDIDSVADLRLAVDEACTRLIRSAAPDSVLTVQIDPGDDALQVHASTTCQGDDAIVTPDSFSWHVLRSLVSDVRTFADGQHVGAGRLVGISLTAKRVGLLQ